VLTTWCGLSGHDWRTVRHTCLNRPEAWLSPVSEKFEGWTIRPWWVDGPPLDNCFVQRLVCFYLEQNVTCGRSSPVGRTVRPSNSKLLQRHVYLCACWDVVRRTVRGFVQENVQRRGGQKICTADVTSPGRGRSTRALTVSSGTQSLYSYSLVLNGGQFVWQNQSELYQFKCTKHLKAPQPI